MISEKRKLEIIDSLADQIFTTNNIDGVASISDNAIDVQTLERSVSDWNAREMSNIVETVEDRIQNDILAAIDSIITRRIELAVSSMNGLSRQDAASVAECSDCGKQSRLTASFENVFNGKNISGSERGSGA